MTKNLHANFVDLTAIHEKEKFIKAEYLGQHWVKMLGKKLKAKIA